MTNEISIFEGKIFVNGDEISFDGYVPINEIARGANGVVFKVFNRTLNRMEVLKIWMKLRPFDSRDKAIQGYLEANKLASSKGNKTAQIYSAGICFGHFYALIEYIEGSTLREWITSNDRTLLRSLEIGDEYINLCDHYGDADNVHGDPHWNNVIVSNTGLRLIDFGTSHFSGKAVTKERHWEITSKTFARLIEPFPFFELIKTQEFEEMSPYDVNLYWNFKDHVEGWLRYLGIVPPARGVSIFYAQNVGSANSRLGKDVRAILDRMDVQKLKNDDFLGRFWHY